MNKFQLEQSLSQKEVECFVDFITLMVIRVPNFRMRYESMHLQENRVLLEIGFSEWSKIQGMREDLREEANKIIKEGRYEIVVNPITSLIEIPLYIFRNLWNIFFNLNWTVVKNSCE